MLSAAGLRLLLTAWGSHDWPEAAGEILASRIETGTSSEGSTMYRPVVHYRYEVNGQPFTSDRLFIGGVVSTSWKSPARRLVERYRPGTRCRVAYDPADPAKACLERGARWHLYLLPLGGAIFLAIGLTKWLAPGGGGATP